MADDEFCNREIISFFSLFHRLHYHIMNEESQCLYVSAYQVSRLDWVVSCSSQLALIRFVRLRYQYLMLVVFLSIGPRL